MQLLEKKALQPYAYSASGNYDRDAFGGLYRSLNLKVDGTASSSGSAGTNTGDAPFRLLGSKVQIQQDGEDLINVSPITLRHLCARLNGGYSKILAVAPATGAPKPILAQLPLDLRKMHRGAAIDARVKPATVRGTFGALTDYGDDGNLSIAANVRFMTEEVPADQPERIWRPSFVDFEKEIFPASTDIRPDVLRFSRPQLVPALAFRVYDASADDRADGLLKNLTVRLTRTGQAGRDLFRGGFGQLRADDAKLSGFGEDDYDTSYGFAMLRLFDAASVATDGVPVLNPGDTIELIYDSSTTSEGEFTSVTPASGDKVVLTKFAFDRFDTREGRVITATDQLQLGIPRPRGTARRGR